MKVLVIDAQGGGIGRQLITEIRKRDLDAEITACGTNSAAAANMIKAGADRAATGENAIRVQCRDTDIIVGPIGIVIADSMLGEVTPMIAQAVGQSRAQRILIPFQNCGSHITGVSETNTGRLIIEAVDTVEELLKRT